MYGNVYHQSKKVNVFIGLVAPVVAQKLMGQSGEILILILILMAVISTGSAEVIAVTSILVYDVYQLYLKVGYACSLPTTYHASILFHFLFFYTPAKLRC